MEFGAGVAESLVHDLVGVRTLIDQKRDHRSHHGLGVRDHLK
jgi:hypothetical protein